MQELTVSSDQAKFIIEAGAPLVVVDESGHMLGHLTPASGSGKRRIQLSDADRAEIKRRMQSSAPGLSTEQVLNYLHSLETA
jgi:hypothetical protein